MKLKTVKEKVWTNPAIWILNENARRIAYPDINNIYQGLDDNIATIKYTIKRGLTT